MMRILLLINVCIVLSMSQSEEDCTNTLMDDWVSPLTCKEYTKCLVNVHELETNEISLEKILKIQEKCQNDLTRLGITCNLDFVGVIEETHREQTRETLDTTTATVVRSILTTETSFTAAIETSTTKKGTSSTIITETPSTAIAETPSTAIAETPSTAIAETPSTATAETPSTAIAATPSTAIAETPSTAIAETPSTTTTEASSTTAAETPSTTTAETPSTTTARPPFSTTAETPFTTITDTTPTQTAETHSTAIAETPPTPTTETPSTTTTKKPSITTTITHSTTNIAAQFISTTGTRFTTSTETPPTTNKRIASTTTKLSPSTPITGAPTIATSSRTTDRTDFTTTKLTTLKFNKPTLTTSKYIFRTSSSSKVQPTTRSYPEYHDCMELFPDRCWNRPDGDFPVCFPLCQTGVFITCVKQRTFIKYCPFGRYTDLSSNRLLSRTVFNPVTRTCENKMSYCSRDTLTKINFYWK